MIIAFDDHGHIIVESARVLHAHAHEEESDHGSHDFPIDADHAGLHSALGDCAELKQGKVEHRPASHETPSPLDTIPQHQATVILPDLRSSLSATGAVVGHFWGSTARVELACISATVILI
jgi:hypothetical protein